MFKTLIGKLFQRRDDPMQFVKDLRNAEVHFDRKEMIITSTMWEVGGFQVGGEPRSKLPLDTTDDAIGEAVLEAVRASRAGLSSTEYAREVAEMFRFAGVRSWGTFERRWIGSILVSGKVGTDELTLYPMRPIKPSGFGIENQDPVFRCGRAIAEVGEAVRKSIEALKLPLPKRRQRPVPQTQSPPPILPTFTVGTKVKDAFGNRGTVVAVNSAAEHGLGTCSVRFDDGQERTYALVASGLEPT